MTLVRKDAHGFAIIDVGGRYHVTQISTDGRLVSSAARTYMPCKIYSISAGDSNEAGINFVSRGRTRGRASAAYRGLLKDKE